MLACVLALLVGCGQAPPDRAVPAAVVPSPPPPDKLTQIADNEATRQPARTMPPQTPRPDHCPKAVRTTIEPVTYAGLKGSPNGPFAAGAERLVNRAVLDPPGGLYLYSVYAGALINDGDQGLLIVFRSLRDPCTDTLGVDFYQHNLLTPQRRGSATIVALDGPTLTLVYAQGGGERLDIETEQFTAVAAPATPTRAPGTATPNIPASPRPSATPGNP